MLHHGSNKKQFCIQHAFVNAIVVVREKLNSYVFVLPYPYIKRMHTYRIILFHFQVTERDKKKLLLVNKRN